MLVSPSKLKIFINLIKKNTIKSTLEVVVVVIAVVVTLVNNTILSTP
jgi:hypothetical protein